MWELIKDLKEEDRKAAINMVAMVQTAYVSEFFQTEITLMKSRKSMFLKQEIKQAFNSFSISLQRLNNILLKFFNMEAAIDMNNSTSQFAEIALIMPFLSEDQKNQILSLTQSFINPNQTNHE